MKKKIEYF